VRPEVYDPAIKVLRDLLAGGMSASLPRLQQSIVDVQIADGVNAIARNPGPEPTIKGLVQHAPTV
jgi:hypothetical protein